GKDIWGQIPEDLISKFQSLLEDRKVYTILNFKVVNAPKQFRNISNRYVIEFTASTTVEEVANMSAIPEDFSVLVLVWGEWISLMDEIVAANGDNSFILIVTSVFVREFNG
ncbi:hypothetical protein LINPERPRIM_LOCUS24769, partial [Linum perenne]